jgi:Tfp pilus assembly protein PilF
MVGDIGFAKTCSAARVKVPAKAEAEFRNASGALEKKDYAEATRRFRAAIAIYPDYDLAYNGLGSTSIETQPSTASVSPARNNRSVSGRV